MGFFSTLLSFLLGWKTYVAIEWTKYGKFIAKSSIVASPFSRKSPSPDSRGDQFDIFYGFRCFIAT